MNFLPQQALLHSPRWAPLVSSSSPSATSRPVVELGFVSAMVGAIDVPQGTPVAEVSCVMLGGEIVGTAELLAGRDIDGLGVGPADR